MRKSIHRFEIPFVNIISAQYLAHINGQFSVIIFLKMPGAFDIIYPSVILTLKIAASPGFLPISLAFLGL